jgi:hypothetical protein
VTSAPSRANCCAAARPIPESPPVTSATFPLSFSDPTYWCESVCAYVMIFAQSLTSLRYGLPSLSQASRRVNSATGSRFLSSPGRFCFCAGMFLSAWSQYASMTMSARRTS